MPRFALQRMRPTVRPCGRIARNTHVDSRAQLRPAIHAAQLRGAVCKAEPDQKHKDPDVVRDGSATPQPVDPLAGKPKRKAAESTDFIASSLARRFGYAARKHAGDIQLMFIVPRTPDHTRNRRWGPLRSCDSDSSSRSALLLTGECALVLRSHICGDVLQSAPPLGWQQFARRLVFVLCRRWCALHAKAAVCHQATDQLRTLQQLHRLHIGLIANLLSPNQCSLLQSCRGPRMGSLPHHWLTW